MERHHAAVGKAPLQGDRLHLHRPDPLRPVDPGEYLEDGDLAGITEFSTPAVLHHLGRAVKAFDREQADDWTASSPSFDTRFGTIPTMEAPMYFETGQEAC